MKIVHTRTEFEIGSLFVIYYFRLQITNHLISLLLLSFIAFKSSVVLLCIKFLILCFCCFALPIPVIPVFLTYTFLHSSSEVGMFTDGRYKHGGDEPTQEVTCWFKKQVSKQLADLDCSSQSKGLDKMTTAVCLKAGWDHYW